MLWVGRDGEDVGEITEAGTYFGRPPPGPLSALTGGTGSRSATGPGRDGCTPRRRWTRVWAAQGSQGSRSSSKRARLAPRSRRTRTAHARGGRSRVYARSWWTSRRCGRCRRTRTAAVRSASSSALCCGTSSSRHYGHSGLGARRPPEPPKTDTKEAPSGEGVQRLSSL